jgi:MFS family permease
VKELVPTPMGVAAAMKKAEFITIGTTAFNLGGLVGTLLTVPIATHLGRRPMYVLYFSASTAALLLTFVPDWEPITRLRLLFTVGVTVFGVFGSFTFYLPELFPSRLRGTGAGFTYNVGRIATAAFPFVVGHLVQSGTNPLVVMSCVALAPLIGVVLVLAGVTVETRESSTPE